MSPETSQITGHVRRQWLLECEVVPVANVGNRTAGHEKGRPLASPQKGSELNFLASAPDHVERHLRQTGKTERTGPGGRQINNPPAYERAAVIDAHHN